ncbi:MAG: zinc ribbon domain-containing protein [Bryobacteraceae bacterium]
MPLYEYRCENCGKTFEKIRRASDADEEVLCPYCESEKTKRLLSAFSTSGCGGGSNRFS